MPQQNKPKILMLGWEYPPLLAGGLGIASQGLGQALTPFTDLEMVVPMAYPPESEGEIQLKGINIEEIEDLHGPYPIVDRYTQIAIDHGLDPYISIDLYGQPSHELNFSEPISPEIKHIEEIENQPPSSFHLSQAYGPDLSEKVMEFGRRVTEFGKAQDFDLIHAHDWMTALPGMELKRETGKPLILHVHSLSYDRSGKEVEDWIYDLEKEAMEVADLIISVSQYSAEVMVEYYGIPREKIHPIHNGIDKVDSFKLSKAFPEKLVCFLGRLARQKGPETFIHTAIDLLKQRNDLRFVLAGQGPLSKELMEKVARSGHGDRIHFTGFLGREKVHELLAMTDLLMMPSLSDPFGLAALEAAQFGVPVLLSDSCGVKEVLPEAPCIPHWEQDAWTRTANWFLDEPIESRELGSKLEIRSRQLSWEKAAEKVMQLYHDLISIDHASL